MEDGDVELRRGVIDVLCWGTLRYYGVAHSAQIVETLSEMGLDIRSSTVSDCLRRLLRRGWIERAPAHGKLLRRYQLTRNGDLYLEMQFRFVQQLVGIAGWLMNRRDPYPLQNYARYTCSSASETPKKR